MEDSRSKDTKYDASADEILVKVENVGKLFCRDLRKSLAYGVMDGLGDLVPSLARTRGEHNQLSLRKGEFWANQGISFELRRGECLGLIGHNGAGKTTLLKMLNGLIKPDVGSIEMRGRVGALIALNVGFNPILTGRENIYITGSIYGMSKKEIDERFDEIVDFAELANFIDSPVQNYSSGMQVRLGFSVASALEPDVLILDEVLAVGDAAFRSKCANRIDSIREKCAVIFVSHSMEYVRRICNRVLLMKGGRPEHFASAVDGIRAYNQQNEARIEKKASLSVFSPLNSVELRDHTAKVEFNEDLRIELDCIAISAFSAQWRIIFRSVGDQVVGESDSRNRNKEIFLKAGSQVVELRVPEVRLSFGQYSCSIVLLGSEGNTVLAAHNFIEFEMAGSETGVSSYQTESTCKIVRQEEMREH